MPILYEEKLRPQQLMCAPQAVPPQISSIRGSNNLSALWLLH